MFLKIVPHQSWPVCLRHCQTF